MFNQVIEKVYDHRNSNSWSAKLRKKRLSFFSSLMDLIPTTQTSVKILDVGGVPEFWQNSAFFEQTPVNVEIYVVNINPFYETHGTNNQKIKIMTGDARNLKQFQDQEFDIVFSNSVIEHVGDYSDQRQMANEAMRVGQRYFIQTPNLYFPIEPHFVFPFFQFLPIELRVELLTRFNLGWLKKQPDRQKAKNIVESIKLLNKDQFVNLFPGANYYEEKIFGLTKSLIVYDGW
ncbi:MAG: class I SAM-dependent methyltransferase [Nostoc sp. ChiSLP01]|nr:class I SAM-dependent methyltransferase [Nostoc sp. CmiSLP01]MDZ8287999.1 class I SAM-dependent methyltransferase [Nostoc sp. ChiSLP01]